MHPKMLTPTYIHDLDVYTTNNYNYSILDEIFKDIDELYNEFVDENDTEEFKDVFNMDAKVSQIKIMKDIVSIRFSDSTIVIISRVDYDDNELFINDYSKDTIIREFALEVY